MTGGRGPDACIDAVGTGGARPRRSTRAYDRVKPAVRPRPPTAPTRSARRSSRLPQGGHGLDPRRLRRPPRQGPVRRGVRQGPDVQDGPDPRPPVPAPAARPDPRRARSTRRSSSPTGCRSPERPRPTGCGTTRPTTARRSSSIRPREPSRGLGARPSSRAPTSTSIARVGPPTFLTVRCIDGQDTKDPAVRKRAAKSTVSGPRRGPRDTNADGAVARMRKTQALAAAFPYNRNKADEIGDGDRARAPKPGATAEPADASSPPAR